MDKHHILLLIFREINTLRREVIFRIIFPLAKLAIAPGECHTLLTQWIATKPQRQSMWLSTTSICCANGGRIHKLVTSMPLAVKINITRYFTLYKPTSSMSWSIVFTCTVTGNGGRFDTRFRRCTMKVAFICYANESSIIFHR
jgi:thiamine pyrophosphokinase